MLRKKFLKLLSAFLIGTSVYAQTFNVSLQPDGTSGKDARIQLKDASDNVGNLNYGSNPAIMPQRWTTGGIWFKERGYIQFDFSSIPDNAIILSANLTLYGVAHNPQNRPNTCYLKRSLSNWDENTITWNNQPVNFSESDKISFGPTTSATQNVVLDVKNHVQNMVNFKPTNFGWVIMLQDETTQSYTKFYAASSDETNTALRPKLDIVYCLPMSISSTVIPCSSPATANGIIQVIVSGGVAPYTYLWQSGSTYSNIINQLPGLYTCTVTDANGYQMTKYFALGALGSPVTIAIRPDALTGKDANISLKDDGITYLNSNYGTAVTTEGKRSTSGGWFKTRSLLQFDLSSIPPDAYISNATLDLYGISHSTGNSVSYLSRNTANWYENIVTWYNQPATESTDRLTLEAASSSTQNYSIDVSTHVRAMVANPSSNFGWQLRLANEAAGQIQYLSFGSSNNITSVLRPQLNLTFTVAQTCDDTRNWVYSKTFGENGEVTGESRVFTDYLGRTTQTQSRSFADNTILASQTLYDGFGRTAGQTLPAPTGQSTLCYKTNFALNDNNQNYSYNDFDKPGTTTNAIGETNNPRAFSNAASGTVGYYYSNNNSAEPYVAADAYPFSTVEFYNDPSGRVKRNAGVGINHKMGSGHENSVYYMCNGGELDYMFGFHGTYERDDNFGWRADKNENLHLIKTVSTNADGKEGITYTNTAGQTIATCISGVGSTCVAQKINQPIRYSLNGFVEIHLPKSKNGTLKFPRMYSRATSGNQTSDAITNLILNGDKVFSNGEYRKISYIIEDVSSGKILQAGASPGTGDYYFDVNTRQVSFNGVYANKTLFLRIAYTVISALYNGIYNNAPEYMNGYYLNKETAPDLIVQYETDYSNWSLNYTDATGRIIATVSPNEVNCNDYLTNTTYSTVSANIGLLNLNDISMNGQWKDGDLSIFQTINDPYGTLNGRTVGSTQSALVKRSPNRYGIVYPVDTAIVKIDTANSRKFFDGIIPEKARNKASLTPSNPSWPIYDVNNTQIGTYTNPLTAELSNSIQSITIRTTFEVKLEQSNGSLIALPNAMVEAGFVGGEGMQTSKVVNLNMYYSVYLSTVNLTNAVRIQINRINTEIRFYGYENVSETAWYPMNSGSFSPIPQGQGISQSLWIEAATYISYLKDNFIAVIANHSSVPNHGISSKNYYDKRGRIIAAESIDEGRSDLVYDNEDKIRFTQNDKQRTVNAATGGMFTYMNYDRAGRVVETGEYNPSTEFSGTKLYFQTHSQYNNGNAVPFGCASVFSIVDQLDGVDDARCSAQQYTAYDYPDASIPAVPGALIPYTQKNTAARISKTWNANTSTWYNYDNNGRMNWALQNINGLGLKTTNYTYNLLGQVLQTVYQQEQSTERFYHHYEYDANGRMKRAYTSFDGINRTLQDNYSYYTHGSLKREEIGGKLQGLDYVYTINGLLKSMNEPTLTAAADPGKDSYAGSSNATFAKDVFGYSIDYYNNDYVRSGTGIQSYNGSIFGGANNTYSGLIKAFRWQTQMPSGATNNMPGILMYEYNYDSKYQLAEARFGNAYVNSALQTTNPQNGTSAAFTAYSDYWVNGINYDLNGNIKTMTRYATGLDLASQPRKLDVLTYNYDNQKKNRLLYITDVINNAAKYTDQIDLPNQPNSANYQYNAIGQLVVNLQENTDIDYDVYGQVRAVYVHGTTTPKVKFEYNDKGLRHKKTIYNGSGVATDSYWYIYDAAGALLSTYHTVIASAVTTQDELLLYAASRIGIYNKNTAKYMYELNDHLGNVRSVITNTGGTAEVIAYTDYYPHGGVMPNRQYVSAVGYKYGYQGQEYDAETGLNNFDLRQYDARIGRWFAPDPYGQYHSPYLAMGNNPVSSVDPDGGQTIGMGGYFGEIPLDNYYAGTDYYGLGEFNYLTSQDRQYQMDAIGTSHGATDASEIFQLVNLFGSVDRNGKRYTYNKNKDGYGWYQKITGTGGTPYQANAGIMGTTADGTTEVSIEANFSLDICEKFILCAYVNDWANFEKFRKSKRAFQEYGGDGSGSLVDNTIYGLNEINKFNPWANAADAINGYVYDTDRHGKPVTGFENGMNTLGAIPLLSVESGVTKTVVTEEVSALMRVQAAKGGTQFLSAAPGKLTQQGLEHIVARHWFTSGAKGAGKFAEGMTARSLKEMIQTTTTQGVFRANTFGRAGTIAEYNFGRVIGTTSGGAPASSMRVVLNPNGNVITAFPF